MNHACTKGQAAAAPATHPCPDAAYKVSARDGTALATDVYLPADHRPAPAVLIRTPYGKRAADSVAPHLAEYLTRAGYAVVIQDVRGTGTSSGRAVPFVNEIADAADTLDWLITQPWSDRRVACWGNSYYGFTAWAAVASGHPAVRALVSRLTSVELPAFTHDADVLRLGPTVEWMRDTWSGTDVPSGAIDWAMRPLAELVMPEHRPLLDGDFTALEEVARCVRAALGHVPTLHCVGWFDLFQQPQLRDWQQAARAPNQWLLATANDHTDNAWSAAGAVADYRCDPMARGAMLERTTAPVIAFLDTVFRTASRDTVPLVRWELAGDAMHEGTTWPPPEAVPWRMHLRAGNTRDGGALADAPDTNRTTSNWTHDPAHLVPMVDRDWWRPLLDAADYAPMLARSDVLSFTSAPLQEAVDLAGPVSVRLRIRSSASTHHLVVTLCDVADNDVSRKVLRAPCRAAGAATDVTVPLGDTGYRLSRGHRLRLHIASSAFPFYLPHSGEDSDAFLAPRLLGSLQSLDTRTATLELTVLPAATSRSG